MISQGQISYVSNFICFSHPVFPLVKEFIQEEILLKDLTKGVKVSSM